MGWPSVGPAGACAPGACCGVVPAAAGGEVARAAPHREQVLLLASFRVPQTGHSTFIRYFLQVETAC
ncbi:MAG: hypothetical protein JJE48_03715 [Actinobacteria bacterium]|nr:hypothetical protein [Actinomycetota bacterium]